MTNGHDPAAPGNTRRADAPQTQVSEALWRAQARGRLFGEHDPVKLGRFVALKPIGSGGMGVVYAAYDEELDRKVAVKLLRNADPREEKRLRAEARALAKLRHPNVVTVFEVGRHNGQLFLAMEYIEGLNLRQWRKSGPIVAEHVLQAFDAAGQGLAAAHAAGLVHRDFKPENVMRGADKVIRVLDFGLARTPGVSPAPELGSTPGSEATGATPSSETLSNSIMGTPPYMAPEQWAGGEIGPAADQFAFAVALWEGLTGTRPFRGRSLKELRNNIAGGTITIDPAHRVPARVEKILRRALQPEPSQRFPNLELMLEQLRRDPGPHKRRKHWLAGTLAGMIAATATSVAVWPKSPDSHCLTDSLGPLWTTERISDFRAAFRATNLPYADLAWTKVQAQVATWTTEWNLDHRNTCIAHQRAELSDSGHDLQMGCLAQRRDEFALYLNALEPADIPTVNHATQSATQLPALKTCRDLARLRERHRALGTQAQRTANAVVERRLQQARVSRSLGRYTQYRSHAQAAQTLALEAHLPRLAAKGLFLQADALDFLGEPDAAIEHARRALFDAVELGAFETAAHSAGLLVWLYGNVQGKLERSEDFAALGLALLEQLEEPGPAAFSLHNALGSAYQVAGQHTSAIASSQRAVDFALAVFGPGSVEVGTSLANLGNAHWRSGDLDRVEELAQQSLELFSNKLGSSHPRTLTVSANLVGLAVERGQLDRAQARAKSIVAAQIRVLGPEHPSVASSLNTQGNIARLLGNNEEAATLLERADDILRRKQGPNSVMRTTVLQNLARTYGAQGRIEQALTMLDETHAVLTTLYGPDNAHLAWVDDARGGILLRAGRAREAKLVLSRGLALLAANDPGNQIGRALQIALTTALLDLGELAAAQNSSTHAAQRLATEPHPRSRAEHEENLARLAAALPRSPSE